MYVLIIILVSFNLSHGGLREILSSTINFYSREIHSHIVQFHTDIISLAWTRSSMLGSLILDFHLKKITILSATIATYFIIENVKNTSHMLEK